MDLELKKPGVTLQLLHVEYRERHPDGYGYTQFCEPYRRWKRTQRVVMRQVHRAGEKLFTDFALGGHFKTGRSSTPENRPVRAARPSAVY